MITLVLEASTYEGSVALVDGDTLVRDRAVAMRGRDHEALMAAVGDVLSESAMNAKAIRLVVCGAGPGSFTSLRIAGAIAKGLAYSTSSPLVPVSSLTLLAASYEAKRPARILTALDAMRGESYVQLYEISADGTPEPLNPAALLPSTALDDTARSLDALVVGPAVSGSGHAVPRAASAVRITNMIARTTPADLAAWEPGYGRLAEAQVKWEAAHGHPLPV